MTEWHHMKWRSTSTHAPQPDLSRAYVQGGTGNLEAPCLGCTNGEVVIKKQDSSSNEGFVKCPHCPHKWHIGQDCFDRDCGCTNAIIDSSSYPE